MMSEAGRQTRAPPHGRVTECKCECNFSRCRCDLVLLLGALVLLAIFLLALTVLTALTVFNVKDPRTTVVSVSVEDLTARTRPRLQFNLTLDVQLVVRNPNVCASFRHDEGSSRLFFHGLEIGEAEILPGLIHAGESKTFRTRVMSKAPDGADKAFAGNVSSGAIDLESRTTIPGRVTIFGASYQHAVSSAVCQITISVSDGKVQSRKCSFDRKP